MKKLKLKELSMLQASRLVGLETVKIQGTQIGMKLVIVSKVDKLSQFESTLL